MYVITQPRDKKRESIFLVAFLELMLANDVHHWIIAAEESITGYAHWQIRADLRWDFETVKKIFPKAHIEESNSWSDYEKKEGNYYCSDDNLRQLQQRFCKLKPWQHLTLDLLNNLNDRQILFIVNPSGNIGKSWLCSHIHESGKGFVVPESIADEPNKIIPFVCNGIKPWHKILAIDIPKANKMDKKMATVLETLKNGLIYDHRYHTVQKNIDCKIVVFTNQSVNVKLLSRDRYCIRFIHEDQIPDIIPFDDLLATNDLEKVGGS